MYYDRASTGVARIRTTACSPYWQPMARRGCKSGMETAGILGDVPRAQPHTLPIDPTLVMMILQADSHSNLPGH